MKCCGCDRVKSRRDSGERDDINVEIDSPPLSAGRANTPVSREGIRVSHLRKLIERCGGPRAFLGKSTMDVCEQFVKSVTSDDKVSYVQYLKNSKRKSDAFDVGMATVFVSHTWKSKFLDVVEALEDHFRNMPFALTVGADGNLKSKSDTKAASGEWSDDEDDVTTSQTTLSYTASSPGADITVSPDHDIDDPIIWLDIFSWNQHEHELRKCPYTWWSNAFKTFISDFDYLVVVAWPTPLLSDVIMRQASRTWCIHEILCAGDTNTRVEVALLPRDHELFLKSFEDDRKTAEAMTRQFITDVSIEKSRATDSEDEHRILKAVERTVGYVHTNATVLKQLRVGIARAAERLVDAHVNSQVEYLSLFRDALGRTQSVGSMTSTMQEALHQSSLPPTTVNSPTTGHRWRQHITGTKSLLGRVGLALRGSIGSVNSIRGSVTSVVDVRDSDSIPVVAAADAIAMPSRQRQRGGNGGGGGGGGLSVMAVLRLIAPCGGGGGESDDDDDDGNDDVAYLREDDGVLRILRLLSRLGAVYEVLEHYIDAERVYLQAVMLSKRLYGKMDEEVLRLTACLANVCLNQSMYHVALTHYVTCLRRRRRLLGVDHPDTLTTQAALADAYGRMGRLPDAKQVLVQLAKLYERKYGEDDERSLEVMHNLGAVHLHLNELKSAHELLFTCSDKRSKILRANHPDTLASAYLYAVTLSREGMFAEAITRLLHIIDAQKSSLGETHASTILSQMELGALLVSQGHTDDATTHYQSAVGSAKTGLGKEHVTTLAALHGLGVAYSKRGQYEEAEKTFRECLNGRQRVLGEHHPDTAATYNSLNMMKAMQG
eukprot:GFYU01006663.1.p1 GENE.GFYU01006663.1~~GFYU01006663.1.p1  ORF type:complete len:830 (-),score=135.37 GFYU01006663.1:299-2788(-)